VTVEPRIRTIVARVFIGRCRRKDAGKNVDGRRAGHRRAARRVETVLKREIRNPKHEARNKSQAEKEESSKRVDSRLELSPSEFENLFRASCLGFRIPRAAGVTSLQS
jgi:hypothetical protein